MSHTSMHSERAMAVKSSESRRPLMKSFLSQHGYTEETTISLVGIAIGFTLNVHVVAS